MIEFEDAWDEESPTKVLVEKLEANKRDLARIYRESLLPPPMPPDSSK
ncbi:MAG TPA: hypothetical protein VFQ61_06365 [Polyangiaceae bacterium]|nr:hypothetical protein [Polyangiaceae bacterium]